MAEGSGDLVRIIDAHGELVFQVGFGLGENVRRNAVFLHFVDGIDDGVLNHLHVGFVDERGLDAEEVWISGVCSSSAYKTHFSLLEDKAFVEIGSF